MCGGVCVINYDRDRMLVATVTASLAAEISLCAVIDYNHCLGWHKWCYNCSIKLASGVLVY